MVNGEIFLGSGASITKVPEVDIYFPTSTGVGATTTITAHTDFSNNFPLVNDLYIGCILKRYSSGNILGDTLRITGNSHNTITFTPSTTLVSGDYFVIESYGAPCPAPKATGGDTDGVATITIGNAGVAIPSASSQTLTFSGGTPSSAATATFTLSAEITELTFASSFTKTNYDGQWFAFYAEASAGAGETPFVVWYDDSNGDSVPSHGIGAATEIEVAIDDAEINSTADVIDATIAAINLQTNSVTAVRSGNVLTITNVIGGNVTETNVANHTEVSKSITTVGGVVSSTTITSAGAGYDSAPTIANITTGTTDATFTAALGAVDVKRLLSDTWLGIVESVTFPTTEVEMKQTNLSLGGSRNWTYQYKGIETAGAADLNLVAHHGSWLYYFFGKCTGVVIADNVPSGTPPTDFKVAESSNAIYIDYGSVTETGPIFFRSVGTVMTPYVNPATETVSNLDKVSNQPTLSATNTITNAITYTFGEQDSDLLPSFALEQVFSKLPSTNTYRTETDDANESLNFVKIARGCRVNTLTMTANENEEVKMTINANTRNVHSLEKTESYEARRGITDETSFFNFTSTNEFREPFFFSDGTFKIFGQSFLKINSLTLTMNNTLTDRRFFGVGSKSVQEAIPSQRTYEIQFTGHVTDDLLYNELLNNTETEAGDNTIELIFTKANGEKITLNFTHYFLSANNFPMADDKGPIVVEATVMPRKMSLCEVTTHWFLQG